MKFRRSLYFLVISGLLICSSCANTEEEPPTSMTPNNPVDMVDDPMETAPGFSIERTDGTTIESSQFAGKNYVIFFFGYSCPPCLAAGPDIESKLYQTFKDNNKFAMIGADQWEGNNVGVDNFQSSTGITFPLGIKAAAMARAFKTTYDRLVVVNDEGFIVYRGNSIAANNLDEVTELVRDLLK